MSVRRLAKDQPASASPSRRETLERRRWWIAKFPDGRQQSAVIPLLWLVQKQEGWVSEPALRVVAELLGMPVIRVLEVVDLLHHVPAGPGRDRRPSSRSAAPRPACSAARTS